jgi:RNA recognition motif-containing protein
MRSCVPLQSLVVHGLPFSYDWVQLQDMMKAAGNICKVDIKRDQQGRSKGWATVLFENDASAQKAIEMFHGSSLHGRTIQVQKDRFVKGGAPDAS